MGALGVIAIIGAVVGIISALREGQVAESVGKYNARVAENQATAVRQAAAADAETKRRQLNQVLGTQRARYGASGIVGSEGSPLLTMMQSEEEAALDVARIRHSGEAQAYGLEARAKLSRFYGREARRQSYLKATSALLGGVAGAAGGGGGSAPGAYSSAPYGAYEYGTHPSYGP